MTQPQVAILVITYNSRDAITECLEACRKFCTEAAPPDYAEILVIDNASGDDTVTVVQQTGFRILANRTNLGFAGAVNQGVQATTAPFILLLNPDAVLQTGIDPLIAACQKPGFAAAGGLLLSSDGLPQRGFTVRRFPTPLTLLFENVGLNRLWAGNPVNWRYRCLDLDLSKGLEVDQPAGAFLMFQRAAWQQLHGFDEGFFPVWFEDVDFCKRLRNARFRIYYDPAAIARHQGAHSIATIPVGKRVEYWYRSLLQYSLRHFDPMGRTLTCLGVLAGSALRLAASGPEYRSTAMRRSYRVVIKLAFRSLWRGNAQFGSVLS